MLFNLLKKLKQGRNKMYFKSQIIPLLRLEEGVRYTPYLDSLGYPTIGVGFKLGPKTTSTAAYTFTLDDPTIDAWLEGDVKSVIAQMEDNDDINAGLKSCDQPRRDILTSMGFQMGVTGLSNFHNMLACIAIRDWEGASREMLDSTWAKQTPARAQRHSEVMLRGIWRPTYNFNNERLPAPKVQLPDVFCRCKQ